MTYLNAKEVKDLVHLSAHQILLFLGNADPKTFTGEAREAIVDFHKNPGQYSQEKLVENGSGLDTAHQFPVRIELRAGGPQGAAQVAAKGIWGEHRTEAVSVVRKEILRRAYAVEARVAGTSSFEFNRTGVHKGLPIRYVCSNWGQVLDQMSYAPGPLVDSRRRPTLIATDGDGTVYGGPQLNHLPLLKDSPVFAALLAYLRAGGVWMLISGNDLLRTFARVIPELPNEVYPRILLSANGGADVAAISKTGKALYLKDYRERALQESGNNLAAEFDLVYVGDDPSEGGNDHPAFEAVGQKRSILVKSLSDSKIFFEKWMHERKLHSV